MGDVIREIEAERLRQVEVEGWSSEHDDEHEAGELADAAACYAARSRHLIAPQRFRGEMHPDYPAYGHRRIWPFALGWWKPRNQRRDLIRAAALIVAEIERIDRAALNPETPDGD